MTSILDTRSAPPAERQDYWSEGIAERLLSVTTWELTDLIRPDNRGSLHSR